MASWLHGIARSAINPRDASLTLEFGPGISQSMKFHLEKNGWGMDEQM